MYTLCHLPKRMDSLQADVKNTMEKLNEELSISEYNYKENIAVLNAKYMIDRIFEKYHLSYHKNRESLASEEFQ